MAITIDQESKQRERLAIDINFLGNRYKTANGLFTFPTPALETLNQHLFYLLKNATQKSFENKYAMRPDYLSFDEYGTVQLAWVLMYVNGVRFVEEFQGLELVIIPSYSAIIEMLKDKFPVQNPDDLTEVDW